MSLFRALTPLAAAAALVSLAAGCGSDETLIKNRVQMELDACKAHDQALYAVPMDSGKPYEIYKSLCDQPMGELKFEDQIYATVPVGPYQFKMRKNTSDGRWHLTQVSWPALDDARSALTWESISDEDYKRILELLTQAEAQAPTIEEIKLTRLGILLRQRKTVDKTNDADPAGLGPADAYYKASVAAATEQNNPDLNARLRLAVIDYYDQYRQTAEEFSVPSESAAEFEAAAIKAVENEVEEAKKAGNEALVKQKLAEIEERKKEMEVNAAQRVKDAARMAELTKLLTARECAEIQAITVVKPNDSELSAQVINTSTLVNCKP